MMISNVTSRAEKTIEPIGRETYLPNGDNLVINTSVIMVFNWNKFNHTHTQNVHNIT